MSPRLSEQVHPAIRTQRNDHEIRHSLTCADQVQTRRVWAFLTRRPHRHIPRSRSLRRRHIHHNRCSTRRWHTPNTRHQQRHHITSSRLTAAITHLTRRTRIQHARRNQRNNIRHHGVTADAGRIMLLCGDLGAVELPRFGRYYSGRQDECRRKHCRNHDGRKRARTSACTIFG